MGCKLQTRTTELRSAEPTGFALLTLDFRVSTFDFRLLTFDFLRRSLSENRVQARCTGHQLVLFLIRDGNKILTNVHP